MLDGVKTQKEVGTKTAQQDWNGICKVCNKQTSVKKVKSLDSSLHCIDYIQTECGHRFLIEHADKKVI